MGFFIVFEGLDGSGKSTQAKRLHEHFISIGENCLLTNESTDGEIGRLARAVTKGELTLEDETLALLFAADRYEHFSKKISPVLNDGGIVVCDRYYHSNIAYQGLSEQTASRILDYNQLVLKRPPDIVFFLDTEPQECLKRLELARKEISIYENPRYLEALRDRYRSLFNRLGENIVTIKTSGKSEDDITKFCLQAYNATMTPPLLA